MEHLGFKIKVEGLWSEDFIMPHQHLFHMFLFVLSPKSCYFEDIVEFLIFRLRTIYNFSRFGLSLTVRQGKIYAPRQSP